jgi:hypothetical protein
MAGNASGIRAGRAYVEMGASDKLSAALDAAKKKLQEFGASVQQVGTSIRDAGLKIAAFGAAAVGGAAAAVAAYTKIAGDFADIAAQTGLSVELLSEMETAVKDAGGTVEGFAKNAVKMQKAIVDAANGGKEAGETFARLGLDVSKLMAMTPDQQFVAIADAISKVQNPSERLALALSVFGKSAATLMPVLAGGAAGIQQMRAEAQRLGLSFTTQTAVAADALGTQMEILKDQTLRVAVSIGEALAPAASEVVAVLQGAVGTIINWIKQNKDAVVAVAAWGAGLLAAGAVIASIGISIVALGSVISGLGTILGALATVVGFLTAAWATVAGAAAAAWTAMTGPVGLAIAGIGALVGAVFYLSNGFSVVGDFVGQVFGNMVTQAVGAVADIKGAIGGIGDAMAAGNLQLAGEILWAGLRVVWFRGVTALRNMWTDFTTTMAQAFTAVEVSIRDGFWAMLDGIASGILWVVEQLAELTGIGAEAAAKFKADYDARSSDQSSARQQELSDRIAMLEEQRGAEKEANAAELESARAELQALREQAADARRQADETKSPSLRPIMDEELALKAPDAQDIPKLEVEQLSADIAGAAMATTQAESKMRSLGTFNATAALGMVGPASAVQQRIATATQQTAANTKELIQAVKASGIVWA